ncbi:MAG: hypothetical protein JO366_03235 [Methylobacteriaceae bacterium]|nr:hypothetical protein [Methylobacteriaceae bacterium]
MRNALRFGRTLALIGIAVCGMAQAQETAFVDFLQGADGRLLFIIKPTNDPITCPEIDTDAITASLATKLGQTILADSLIEKPSASYVYWISNKNGPHQVFVAQFFLRSCAIKEERSEEKSFESALKFKQAWQYYNELLRRHSTE